jgi:tellurite resistance protein
MADTSVTAHSRLEHFPIAFFAVVMGLGGFTLAARASEHALGASNWVSGAALIATIAAFTLITIVYIAKAFRYPEAVAAEWAHPVRIAFFPAVSVSILLIATAIAPLMPDLARGIWLVGAALQAILTLAVVANWIGHRLFEQAHLTPAWFIPAVGNVIVPVAGPPLGYVELSWLFFSAGMMFWLVLLTLVVNRLIFHSPLPGRLLPTLVILIAPPAVAFIAWLRLTGEVDGFARILLNAGYVWAGVVLTQAPKFRRLPFALSWWALSFPVAALSVASLLFASETGSTAHKAIGLALVALLTVILVGLGARTVGAMKAQEICRPE